VSQDPALPGGTAPAVSVILPTYNGLQHLAATVDSVMGQTLADHELIVVDDGSTDGTADWVRQHYPGVRLIERSNGGISRARNTGLAAARGRYVAFLDHDDIWHPHKLAQQVRWLDELPAEVGCDFGEFRAWDGSTEPNLQQPLPYPPVEVPELCGWIYHQLLLTNWVLFSTALFRREVFAEVGNFDPDLPPADDWDMALRVSRRFQMMKTADVLALYRQHPGQTSRRVFDKDPQTRLRESMLLRYGPWVRTAAPATDANCANGAWPPT
jgi:glycosyltransferase involved in cell wall biosynthesis